MFKNSVKEISSLQSLRQKDGKLAATNKEQETKLKQFLKENKNLNERVGYLESILRTQANKPKDECSLCYEIVRY